MAQWTQGIMLACCCGFRVVAAPLRCPSCVISVFLLTERWLVGGIPKALRIVSRHRSERRGLGPNMHWEDLIRVFSERSPRSDSMAGFVPWFRRPGAAPGGLGATARRELRFWRYRQITSQITHQGQGDRRALIWACVSLKALGPSISGHPYAHPLAAGEAFRSGPAARR